MSRLVALMNWYGGWGVGGWLLMSLIMLAVVALIVVGMIALTRRSNRTTPAAPVHLAAGPRTDDQRPSPNI